MIGLLIVTNLVSVLVCYRVSASRSADRRFWTIAGLLCGPFAIPFVFFAKPYANSVGNSTGASVDFLDDAP